MSRMAAGEWALAVVAGGALAVAAALATGHLVAAALVAAVPLGGVAVAAGAQRLLRVPAAPRAVGVVWTLLACSTFVWRTRTTQALASNPLDSAALLRVALVAAAAFVTLGYLVSFERIPRRRLPAPLLFLAGYVLVAALAASDSPVPSQAFYRVFELGVGLTAVVLAVLLLGERAGEVLLRLAIGTVGTIVAVLWIEAVVFPSHAWARLGSFVTYQLVGYVPTFAADTVGTLGGILALWGLARPYGRTRGADLALVAGVATLVASQYRTGIIGFLVVSLFVAAHRRRGLFAVLVAVAALGVVYLGASEIRTGASTALARGRPELVGSLNGRTAYWNASLPFIRERPVFGWGLNVETRHVLVSLGDNTTSTLHSTWFEALLGTGVVGAALLAAALATTLVQAWRARRHPMGIAIVGLVAFVVVRSITGTTIELFGLTYMLVAALAVAAAQLPRGGSAG